MFGIVVKTILVLEDNDERIEAFQNAVAALGDGFGLRVWRDAPSMMTECEQFFPSAALISLDHDLNPAPGATADPGDGLEVARFLGDFMPVCPALIHSSNTDAAWSMHNELRFAGWMVDRVGPLGNGWIKDAWFPRAQTLLRNEMNSWKASLPPDHADRVKRMVMSLDGLSIGDALGEMLSYQARTAARRIAQGDLPGGPWFHTDDTEMAISIVAVLKSHGSLDQDGLAKRFARRFERDPDRGYGKMTRIQMREIMAGAKWQDTASNAFGGQGSMGNGGAMRVAPLGAYFSENYERCALEARASSLVTHTHPEGVAGAIAVAVASAAAWKTRAETDATATDDFFDAVLRHTPDSRVRRGIVLARSLPLETSVTDVARVLGNGSQVTAPDTVPFCVWMAARFRRDFVGAMGATISADGDCDTNAAIVGGIVALSAGPESIPKDWINAKEPIRI